MGICETLSNDKYDDKNHKYKVSNKKKKKVQIYLVLL